MARHVRRVAVLTADVGEGHLAAARVVEADLRAASPGIEVTTLDALELLGPALRVVLRDAYRLQLRRVPWLFALLFGLFLRVRPFRALGRLVLASLGARRMDAALRAARPDLVVSTYPAATSVLGTLRRRGRLGVPACATVTDLAGVQFWAHRGIDLHLVMHPALVPLVEREAGASSARAVAPLVAAQFRVAPTRARARRALDLPQGDRVVVVSGGGWGVGDVAGAVDEASRLEGTTVVCLTGRNARLHAALASRFSGRANVRLVAFTERMDAMLAAADVLVHTTGGVTCLEAMTVGRPIVAFGPPAGHAPTLARAMARLGVATYARTRAELRAALIEPPAAAPVPSSSSAVGLLLRATPRSSPAGAGRRRVAAAVALATAVGMGVFLMVGSRSAFAVIAYPFHLAPRTVLPTRAPAVGLVVETSPTRAAAVAHLLARRRAGASFAFAQSPSRAVRRALEARHDEVIAVLGGSGVDDWFGAADVDGTSDHLVLVPTGGVSTGQYLLARLAGAQLVAAGSSLRPGAIVACDPATLGRVLERLARRGLRAEPVGALAS